MFPTGAFNSIAMGFQYPGQQPPASLYQSQYGGFNLQVPPPPPFQPAPPPRGQSLPASNRQYPPSNGPYAQTSSRRNGQYPPPAPSQHYEYHTHGSKSSKKHHKRRSASPTGVADQSLYSDKEKNDRSRSQSPVLGSHSKQEGSTTNDQEQQSQTVDSASGEISQGGTIGTEDQQNSDEKEKRKSRSKKKKNQHRHEYYNNQYQQQQPPPPPYYGELPPQMRVHQQPLYSGYNQAYEESIRRGDVYHKQAKRSTRLPPEAKQQLLPHEDDQQKQYQYPGYPQQQQPFPGVQPPFNPYQPYAPQQGFFGPTNPYNVPQPWSNVGGINGPAEQEIQRLRSHIHTLEGELHKLQKKLNKATLNTDDNTRTHRRSKHDEIGSPRQTPVIVELNSTTGETNRESSPKKKHRHRHGSSQQGQNLGQQSGENTTDQNVSNQQQIDSREHSRSVGETEGKPSVKSAREETAAQLAHAAAAHVNARQQVPPPPPVQQQYVYQQGGFPPQQQQQQIRGPAPRFPVAGNVRYPNDPYQQRNMINPNYNQSNNNELFDNNEERRNRRSADKILDAFERFYMNKSTTAPMKVKYIPEENNSNHQRNTNNNNNNNNRDSSTSQSSSSSSSNWSKNGIFTR